MRLIHFANKFREMSHCCSSISSVKKRNYDLYIESISCDFLHFSVQSVKRNEDEAVSKEPEEKEEDIVEKWKKGRFRPKVATRRSFNDRNGATRGRGGFRGTFRRGFASERTRQREFERERREPRKRSRSRDRERAQENRKERKELARRSRSAEKGREMRERLPGRFNRDRSRSQDRQRLRNQDRAGFKLREKRKNSDEEYEEKIRPRDIDDAKQRKGSFEGTEKQKGRWDQRGDREETEPTDEVRSKWSEVSESKVDRNGRDTEKKRDLRKGHWDQRGRSKDTVDRRDLGEEAGEEKGNEYSRKALEAKSNNNLESHDVDAFGRDISKRNEYRKVANKDIDESMRLEEQSGGGLAVKSHCKDDSISLAGESVVEEKAEVNDEANADQAENVDKEMKVGDSAAESISGLKGGKKKKKKHRKLEKRNRKETKKHKKRRDKIKGDSDSDYEERDHLSNPNKESEMRSKNDMHSNTNSKFSRREMGGNLSGSSLKGHLANKSSRKNPRDSVEPGELNEEEIMEASLNADARRDAILREEVMRMVRKGIELTPLTPKAEQVLAMCKTGSGSESEKMPDVSNLNKGNRIVARKEGFRSFDVSDHDRSSKARKLSLRRAGVESRKRQRKEESDSSDDDYDYVQDREKHGSNKRKTSLESKQKARNLRRPDVEVARSRTRKSYKSENDSDDTGNDEVEGEKRLRSRKLRRSDVEVTRSSTRKKYRSGNDSNDTTNDEVKEEERRRSRKLLKSDVAVARSRTRRRYQSENDSDDISSDEVEQEKGSISRKRRADQSIHHKGADRNKNSSRKHEETSDSDSADDSKVNIRYRSSKVRESERKRLVESREVHTRKQRPKRRKRESSSSEEDSDGERNRRKKGGRTGSFDAELKHKVSGKRGRYYSESLSADEKRNNSKKAVVSKHSLRRKDREESSESDQRIHREQRVKSSGSDSSSEADSRIHKRNGRNEKKSDKKNEKGLSTGREDKLKRDVFETLKSKREQSSETDESRPRNRKSSRDKDSWTKRQDKKEHVKESRRVDGHELNDHMHSMKSSSRSKTERKFRRGRGTQIDDNSDTESDKGRLLKKKKNRESKKDLPTSSDADDVYKSDRGGNDRRNIAEARNKGRGSIERKRSSIRRKRDSVSESDSEDEGMSERRKVGKGREKRRDLSERMDSSTRKRRDSSSASSYDSSHKDVREVDDRRKTGRARNTDATRATSSRNMRGNSSESRVRAKGEKGVGGSSKDGKMLSGRRRKTDDGNSSDDEERETKERRNRLSHKEEQVEGDDDKKIELNVKDNFNSRGNRRNSQRKDVDISESASGGFKVGQIEKVDYGGWKSVPEVSNEQNHDDHDTTYCSETVKNVAEKDEGVSFPWKLLESTKMEARDVLGIGNDDRHAMDNIPDNVGFSETAKVDAGEIPDAQTGKEEAKVDRTEMQDDRGNASSSDFSLYGDIDLEDIRKRSKLEKITKGVDDSGQRNSHRKNRRHKEVLSDTDSDHEKGRSYRKGRRYKDPLSDSDDSSDVKKGRSHRKDHRRRAMASGNDPESLDCREGRQRSRSPKQLQRQRTKDSSSSTEHRKTVVQREGRTGHRGKEVHRKADRHLKKSSSDSESDDQKKRGKSPASKVYKSKGRQISSSDESDRYVSRAKRARKSKATRRSSSFSSWSSSSESDERHTKDPKRRGKYPHKREGKRSEDARTRFRRTDSVDSSS